MPTQAATGTKTKQAQRARWIISQWGGGGVASGVQGAGRRGFRVRVHRKCMFWLTLPTSQSASSRSQIKCFAPEIHSAHLFTATGFNFSNAALTMACFKMNMARKRSQSVSALFIFILPSKGDRSFVHITSMRIHSCVLYTVCNVFSRLRWLWTANMSHPNARHLRRKSADALPNPNEWTHYGLHWEPANGRNISHYYTILVL